MELEIEYVPIDSIKPYTGNAKLHPQEQIDQIKRSIDLLGFDDPIAVCRLYVPSELDSANYSIRQLFTMSLRITSASAVMFFISNLADVLLFSKIKQLTRGKHLWLRNNVATILCNCLENFLFYILAFYPAFTMQQIVSMGLATCLLECIIGVADTPFLYLAKYLKHGDEIEDA